MGSEMCIRDRNYSSLGTGNRFRLLFGQSYPLECRTNQSAKYTHTLFITLQGAPKITEEPPELDGTLGSHSATFQISVGQQALRDALAQYLDIASSDSSVLEITGITVTPDAQYSDLATVTVLPRMAWTRTASSPAVRLRRSGRRRPWTRRPSACTPCRMHWPRSCRAAGRRKRRAQPIRCLSPL